MFKILSGIFAFLLVLVSIVGHSQSRSHCGFVDFSQKLLQSRVIKDTESSFEEWMKKNKVIRSQSSQSRQKTNIYNIPVVVHVIHNGEPIGTGANISDAQILSQIKVLNDDFQRLNSDTSSTPTIFKNVAAGINIQFGLAKRNPTGGKTTGIVRVNGNRSGWRMSSDTQLKALSYWPAEDYLNIWVCNLVDFLGYAQFPVSNLPGLEDSPEERLTDGVVIWHEAFGSVEHGNFTLDPSYNRGRTTTHEVGHFFGLRHIWGDMDDCLGTDYVDDTPIQETSSGGCPTHPHATCTPWVVSMFQNYMDYSDDRCMNLFTAQQVERMETVIQNSVRRASLLESNGLFPPEPVANDIGFRSLVSPRDTECKNQIVPAVKIENFGKNTVTSASLQVMVNGELAETRDINFELDPQDSLTVTFNELDVSSGINTITFEIILTNGVSDGDNVNNSNVVNTTVNIPDNLTLPVFEQFSFQSTLWSVRNVNGGQTWGGASILKELLTEEVMKVSLGEEGGNTSQPDILFSPIFNLSSVANAALSLDYAYAADHYNFYSESGDHSKFRIYALADCETFEEATLIFERSGHELATQPTYGNFVPNRSNDWSSLQIDLSQFAGHEKVQLAFVGVPDDGNVLFVDNVAVASRYMDVKLKNVRAPGLVTCDGARLSLVVQNIGTVVIETLKVNVAVNNVTPQVISKINLHLQPGEERVLEMPNVQFIQGQNLLDVTLSAPNGITDSFTANNRIKSKVVVDRTTDRVPLRQNFDEEQGIAWRTETVASGVNFEPGNFYDAFGESVGYAGFSNTTLGDEAWLVTPVLDFSGLTQASVTFDISNANATGANDFKVLVSKDCGLSYEEVMYVAPVISEWVDVAWEPDSETKWVRSHIDLSTLAGNDSVRIAWVNTNGGGNNLFLDNFEFFLSSAQRDVNLDAGFNIYGYNATAPAESNLQIGFNLESRKNVTCEVIDLMGRKVGMAVWGDVLNQIYQLPLEGVKHSGTYVIRLNIDGNFSSQRIVVVR